MSARAVLSVDAVIVLGWLGAAALAGLALVVLGRRLMGPSDRRGPLPAVVLPDDARLRTDQRRILARELPDVVIHHLSNVSLQAMSHVHSIDPEELHRVLRTVNRSTGSALTEMRLLVRVLRDDSTTAAGADEIGELSSRVAPTAAAATWVRWLLDAGFAPDITMPAEADRLEMTAQATISRTVAVTCDNVLQHAPAQSWCALRVTMTSAFVVIRTSSRLPPAPGAVSLGRSLRGLRERVDLTGGTFSAGPATSGSPTLEWVVVVALPL